MQQKILEKIDSKIKVIDTSLDKIYAMEVDVMLKVEDIYENAIDKLIKYQGTTLQTRLSLTKVPITSQDMFVPATEDLSFENYLAYLMDCKNHCEQNFVFTQGHKTDLKPYNALVKVEIKDVQIKKIICYYDDKNILWGFKLFDIDNKTIFESLYNASTKTPITTELEEGERIVGMRGRKYNDSQATYYDFQFVIGKLA